MAVSIANGKVWKCASFFFYRQIQFPKEGIPIHLAHPPLLWALSLLQPHALTKSPRRQHASVEENKRTRIRLAVVCGNMAHFKQASWSRRGAARSPMLCPPPSSPREWRTTTRAAVVLNSPANSYKNLSFDPSLDRAWGNTGRDAAQRRHARLRRRRSREQASRTA